MPSRPPVQRRVSQTLATQARTRKNRDYDAKRREEQPSRGWYSTSAWKRIRRRRLAEEPLCRMCGAQGRITAANTADHIEPHRGEWELFADYYNTQSLCGPHHNSTKQALEQALNGKGAMRHPEWLRPSTVPLIIVCGPPAAGKSTYIAERAGKNDLVLDLDTIAAKLSGQSVRTWDRRRWLKPALRYRNHQLGLLSRTPCPWPRAWLIVQEADPQWRQWWVDKLKPERVVVIETPLDTCWQRIDADEHRTANREQQRLVVSKWWRDYQRRDGDQIIC